MENLPRELQFAVRNAILRDPDTTFDDYKSLRLVCSTFDLLFSPIVMVNITLFPGHPGDSQVLRRIRQLVKGKNYTFGFNTLTLKNWDSLDTGVYSPYIRRSLLELVLCLLIFAPFLPLLLATLLRVSLTSPKEVFLTRPKEIFMLAVNFTRAKVEGRWYISLLNAKKCFLNVRRARLFLDSDERAFAAYYTTKTLMMLPQLTELELQLASNADMPYISKRLSPLSGLRKFSLQINSVDARPSSPHCFSTVIANNPNLTHLALASLASSNASYDVFEMLRDVPTNRPLMLEHLTVDGRWRNIIAFRPHVQSLLSCSIANPCVPVTNLDYAIGFPPTFIIGGALPSLSEYLIQHPGIINLSIAWDCIPNSVLDRHAETLQFLTLKTTAFASALWHVKTRLSFLRCTKLRELVLCCGLETPKWCFENILAHLSHLLIVVIRHESIAVFKGCLEFCRNSDNPLVRDLTGRLVYEAHSSCT